MLVTIVVLFVAAFLLSYLLIPVFEKFACKRGYVTAPTSNNIDARSMPYFGGIVMFFTTIAIFSVGFFVFSLPIDFNQYLSFVIASAIIVLWGARDHRKDLSPGYKLIGQFLGACIITFFSTRTELIYLNPVFNLLLSIFWIMLVINAFNLLDILDGLAGSIALINMITFFVFAYLTNNIFVMVVSVILSAAIGAFLLYNLPPARIFMGDAGSQFLGFVLAVMAVSLSFATQGKEVGGVIPLVILAIPLMDILFVVFMRMMQKKSIFLKSNDHFVFRMLKYGVSNENILKIMVLFAILTSGCAFIIFQVSNIAGGVVFCFLTGVFFFVGYKLSR